MIRLVTLAAGGEGWLNFMGNEFGHPEWIDFPREGNGNSYQYCRRQWSLVDNPLLRYRFLNMDEHSRVMAFERANLIFVFNWNGERALLNYRLPTHKPGEWEIVLDSDALEFGGLGRQDIHVHHLTDENHCISLYLLPRTALALRRTPELR